MTLSSYLELHAVSLMAPLDQETQCTERVVAGAHTCGTHILSYLFHSDVTGQGMFLAFPHTEEAP